MWCLWYLSTFNMYNLFSFFSHSEYTFICILHLESIILNSFHKEDPPKSINNRAHKSWTHSDSRKRNYRTEVRDLGLTHIHVHKYSLQRGQGWDRYKVRSWVVSKMSRLSLSLDCVLHFKRMKKKHTQRYHWKLSIILNGIQVVSEAGTFRAFLTMVWCSHILLCLQGGLTLMDLFNLMALKSFKLYLFSYGKVKDDIHKCNKLGWESGLDPVYKATPVILRISLLLQKKERKSHWMIKIKSGPLLFQWFCELYSFVSLFQFGIKLGGNLHTYKLFVTLK